MIRIIFKSFFKRFFGLFISMVFVSMLSVGLLCCFGSCIIDVRDNYQTYVKEYCDIDELVSINGFVLREKLTSLDSLEEVEKYDARLTVDCYLYKEEKDRTIVTRVFSYNEQQNKIFKRYVVKSTTPSEEFINIGVCQKFAKNNNFQLGQTVRLGFFGIYEKFYISEILETPEGIYPRANNYIWSDNQDFGYIYTNEKELNKGLYRLAKLIEKKIADDETFKEYYEKAIAVTGITIPDIATIDENFASRFANQVLIKNAKGNDLEKTNEKIEKHLKANSIDVKSSITRSVMPHIAYMNHALEQVQIASIFLPVFFYTVTMIIIGLFINQIIKTMTPQIGVMMSIGVDQHDIVKLFIIFVILMCIASGLLGAPIGYFLSIFMATVMKNTYSIPMITPKINPFVTIGAIVGLLIFAIVTALISTRAIFRITPKDAVISNESKRKSLPKRIEKFIDKAPMNIKLGTNAIVQNPRRFFVSTFSIFASLVLMLLSSLFMVSKDEMIDQSINRRLTYDCQIYLTQKEEPEFIEELRGQEFVTAAEDCYYTYLKVDVQGKDDVYLECLATEPGTNPLINIPRSNGRGDMPVPESGIILPKTSAEKLKVKKGDTISINGKQVAIAAISYQYFHPITYLSKSQMDLITNEVVSSYIVNITKGSDAQLLRFLSDTRNQCLTVFTESLSKDLHAIFDAINVMIYIMVGFSVGMAFIILLIMSQNALMEQKRQLTILRAIGFTVMDISHVWTLQSASQLVVASLFGVPAGALAISVLLNLASSATQTYPFIFSWLTVLITIGFAFLVIVACHLLAMNSIKQWNIADNTRCRE